MTSTPPTRWFGCGTSRRSCGLARPNVVGVALGLRNAESVQFLGNETVLLEGSDLIVDQWRIPALATFGAFVQAHRSQAISRAQVAAEGFQPKPGDACSNSLAAPGSDRVSFAKVGAHVTPWNSSDCDGARSQVVQNTAVSKATSVSSHSEASAFLRARSSKNGVRFVIVNRTAGGRASGPRAISRSRHRRSATCPAIRRPGARSRSLRAAWVSNESLQPIDMIPMTDEVEVVAILRPRPCPCPESCSIDPRFLSSKSARTSPQRRKVKYHSSLLQRVRRIPGAEEAVPVHRLDIGTSGLVLFAKHPRYTAAWADSLHSEFRSQGLSRSRPRSHEPQRCDPAYCARGQAGAGANAFSVCWVAWVATRSCA